MHLFSARWQQPTWRDAPTSYAETEQDVFVLEALKTAVHLMGEFKGPYDVLNVWSYHEA